MSMSYRVKTDRAPASSYGTTQRSKQRANAQKKRGAQHTKRVNVDQPTPPTQAERVEWARLEWLRVLAASWAADRRDEVLNLAARARYHDYQRERLVLARLQRQQERTP